MVNKSEPIHFISHSRDDMGEIFPVPDSPSQICSLRETWRKCPPNIKMVAIGLHSGTSIKHWIGVYGVKTPEKELFINPFSVFTFDGIRSVGDIKRLTNVKYI